MFDSENHCRPLTPIETVPPIYGQGEVIILRAVRLSEVLPNQETWVAVIGNYPPRANTTVNMHFKQHYRPTQDVLTWPLIAPGHSKKTASHGYASGHHKLMIPLLAPAHSYNGRRP